MRITVCHLLRVFHQTVAVADPAVRLSPARLPSQN